MTMLEKMTRAIGDVVIFRGKDGSVAQLYGGLHPDTLTDIARAALMAMREPSEDFMLGMYPDPTGEAIVAPHVAGDRSRRQGRMQIARYIDAILAEGGE